MNCIAIDDEPRALAIIENFVNKIDFLEIKSTFRDPLEAIDFLSENDIDLIFLDINMPNINGTELVKVLKHQPMVVFTTAYSEYAIESYELDAIDYLLKPFEFERFLKSVIKAREIKKLKYQNKKVQFINPDKQGKYIHIKSGSETHQVKIDEIKYIEGLGNYANVYVNDKKLITYSSLKDLLDTLPAKQFVRIHKSYIVAVKHIKSFEPHQVKLENQTIPIGKSYRKDFLGIMESI